MSWPNFKNPEFHGLQHAVAGGGGYRRSGPRWHDPAGVKRRFLPRPARPAISAAAGRRHRLQRRRHDHRFHIHDGQCDFRQRWAKTDKWKLENEAGKALFGAYRNPLTDDEA
jgi:hypothetical protein